ncbi:MAG: hypothetical protein ACRDXX_15530 [Stackebrandtia sp.]
MNQFSPADLADRAPHDPDLDAEVVMRHAAEAVERLDGLSELPTARHVDVFESVQQTLADTLSAVDEA